MPTNNVELVKHTDYIWEYKQAYLDGPQLITSIQNDQWGFYSNQGGVTGKITSLSHDKKNHNVVFDIFYKYISEYIDNTNIDADINNIDGGEIFIRKYDTGSYLTEHQDVYGQPNGEGIKNPLVVTALLYLNDDFDGGEIYFPEKGISIKPDCGSLVVFPSKTVHGVKTLISGNRYLTSIYIYEGGKK